MRSHEKLAELAVRVNPPIIPAENGQRQIFLDRLGYVLCRSTGEEVQLVECAS